MLASRVLQNGMVWLSATMMLAACGEAVVAAPPAGEAGGAAAEALGLDFGPLSAAAVPAPKGGTIVNPLAAIQLGKALFWDVQVGGDGAVACATCHYHAGADTRRINTVHPGPNGVYDSVAGPGADLPHGGVSGDDIVGSQGVVAMMYADLSADPQSAIDQCIADEGATLRQVTGRNTPSAVGAALHYTAFWDGRADTDFNGLDPFGGTENADSPNVVIRDAPLASQAVGPANNEVEMSCAGRPFNGEAGLGQKLLARTALAHQTVAPDDGVLGPLASPTGRGLRCNDAPCSYRDLVARAFGSDAAVDAEERFSSYFGQAVQAYEATLLPDQTPFDAFLAGDTDALSPAEQRGLAVFVGPARCLSCHAGTELSDAAWSLVALHGRVNQDGGDQGFHNLGLRPTAEDLGRASVGLNGISFSRSGARADRGAFKTPGLRNVALTAPYMHTGGLATLADVVDFYIRGGDFANSEKSSLMAPLMLSRTERADLIAFLEGALTDERVLRHAAPFDHPMLAVPNGPVLPATGVGGVDNPLGF